MNILRRHSENADYSGTDVQEGPPTNDQLSTILDYLGASKAGTVVQGASDASDALKKFKANENAFQRPVVVDWNNGRAGTWDTSANS